MQQKIVVSFRIADDLKSGLERLADADDRSLSNYIERALRAHVDAQEAAGKAAGAKGRKA